MNLEELKSRIEKGFHADEKELYADIFNPSLVSKLLRVVEAASGISEGSDWNNGPYANKHRHELLAALRDLEQS